MIQLQAEINKLCNDHPKLNKKNRLRGIEGLEKMAAFYERKAPESRDGGRTFYGYAATLIYARDVLLLYHDLTRRIAELAEGPDENRTDSES